MYLWRQLFFSCSVLLTMSWITIRGRCYFARFMQNLSTGRGYIASRCISGPNGGPSIFGWQNGLVSGLISNKSFMCFHEKTSSVVSNYSRHYPDFPNNRQSDGSSSTTNPTRLLEILENASEKRDYQQGIQVFEDFQRARPDWFKQWPAQKINALILHMYLQAGTFDKLLAFYDELKQNGFVHGEGIYVTLIKCCIAINNMPKALEFLEELKSIGLRNIRIYRYLIMAFINDNNLNMAYRLFKEMQHYEFNQKTKKQFKDQGMLSSLLHSAAAGVRKCDDQHDEKFRVELVNNVLDYLSTRGIVISMVLRDAILKAVDAFNKDYSVEIVKRGQFNSNRREFHDAIVNETDIDKVAKLFRIAKKSFLAEEELLRDFVAKHGPFSSIVDGANVMLARKDAAANQLTTLNEHNIIDVLRYYKRLFHRGKFLIVIPSTMERRSMFSESLYYKKIKNECYAQIFVTEQIVDDVALLLATLYNDVCLIENGLDPCTTLITNDSLREHLSITGEHQLKLKLWLQSKQLKFSWDSNNKIILNDNLLPIPKASGRWSLQLWDGQIMNVCFKTR